MGAASATWWRQTATATVCAAPPSPGDYQGYLYYYDKRQQKLAHQEKLVGRVTYADGTKQEFTDPQQHLRTIREELPYRNTTGFRYETLTDDPQVKKAADDAVQQGLHIDRKRRRMLQEKRMALGVTRPMTMRTFHG